MTDWKAHALALHCKAYARIVAAVRLTMTLTQPSDSQPKMDCIATIVAARTSTFSKEATHVNDTGREIHFRTAQS